MSQLPPRKSRSILPLYKGRNIILVLTFVICILMLLFSIRDYMLYKMVPGRIFLEVFLPISILIWIKEKAMKTSVEFKIVVAILLVVIAGMWLGNIMGTYLIEILPEDVINKLKSVPPSLSFLVAVAVPYIVIAIIRRRVIKQNSERAQSEG